jgi:hypothetical protein
LNNKCKDCGYQFNADYFYKCPMCGCKTNREPPYSDEEYEDAKLQELNLDDWDDYAKYFGIGEEIEYE